MDNIKISEIKMAKLFYSGSNMKKKIGDKKLNNLNIRLYKSIVPSGDTYFTEQETDDRGSGHCSNIASLASKTKWRVEDHIKKNKFCQVTIDFKPYHDIECPSDLSCRRNYPLNQKEQEEFWKYSYIHGFLLSLAQWLATRPGIVKSLAPEKKCRAALV